MNRARVMPLGSMYRSGHDVAITARPSDGFPPCRIERRGEGLFRLTLALAGFSRDDVSVELCNQVLCVTGYAPALATNGDVLHHEFATAFCREFDVAADLVIEDIAMRDGLLVIDLVRDVIGGRAMWVHSPIDAALAERVAA